MNIKVQLITLIKYSETRMEKLKKIADFLDLHGNQTNSFFPEVIRIHILHFHSNLYGDVILHTSLVLYGLENKDKGRLFVVNCQPRDGFFLEFSSLETSVHMY